MKAKDFLSKVNFNFNGASSRGSDIPKAVKTKINQANIPDELRPKDIYTELEDNYTLVIHWETQEWCWDTCDVANEIERYYKYYAEKLGLEEDILIILRIRSRDSYVNLDAWPEWRRHELQRLKDQRDVIKINISAVKESTSTVVGNKIAKDKLKIYTLAGDNIHWFYQTTGKNFSRAALILDKAGNYKISRDDMGSDIRLIGIGAKKRGDGHTNWSGYSVDGNIKCVKLLIPTQFKEPCYVALDTLTEYNEFIEGLFEVE